jgi:predicted ATPase
VILDDWHHADAASATCWPSLPSAAMNNAQPGARELVLYRPELAAPASASLRRLHDSSDALQLRLAPLADDAVLTLLQTLSGVAKPLRFAARLQQATRGNPFFLAETLRHLAERRLLSGGPDGVWHTPYDSDTQDYRELPVPRSVHEAVLDRVQRLGPAAQRVLEAACLAAEPFAPGLLAPACALSELDTVLAIEQAWTPACCVNTKPAALPLPTTWCSRRWTARWRPSAAAWCTAAWRWAPRPRARARR